MATDIRRLAVDQIQRFVEDEDASMTIEASVYDYTCGEAKVKGILENIDNSYFRRIYVNKLYSLMINMDPESYIKNQDLLQEIKEGKVDLERIAYLTPQEIYAKHWKKYIDKQSANDEFIYNRVVGIRTTDYRCKRCKKNDCSYYQLQVRCNDEPMTTFVNCLNCGNKWSY